MKKKTEARILFQYGSKADEPSSPLYLESLMSLLNIGNKSTRRSTVKLRPTSNDTLKKNMLRHGPADKLIEKFMRMSQKCSLQTPRRRDIY